MNESPDDRQNTRDASAKTIASAVTDEIKKLFPPLFDQDGSIRNMSAAHPHGTETPQEMDGGLHVRVDTLERQFKDFRHEIGARFDSVTAQLEKGLANVQKGFDSLGQTREASWGRIASAAGVIVVVALGFGGYVKSNIEGSLTDNRHATEKLESSLARFIDKADARFDRLADLTIPKEELNNRLAVLRETQTGKVDKDVFKKTTEYRDDQIASIRGDIATLKNETLKREDLDGRFSDFTKRLDLISNRVERLQGDSSGAAVLQEQVKGLTLQVAEVRSRLLAAPKYLVHPDGN